LFAQRKRNKRKGAFSKVFFSKAENQFCFAKIFPGFQDFLTQNKTYTAEKDSKSAALKRQNRGFLKFLY